jgi:uncharacterized protein
VARIIDAHIHLSERKDDALRGYAKKNGLRYTLDELLGMMSRHHVERGLLLSPPLDNRAALPNEEVIELSRRSRGRLSPVVTVEPGKKQVAAAVKLAEENGREVRGFKVRLGYVNASPESPVFGEAYDFAEGERLPVLFHTGDTATSDGDLTLSHPLTLDRLANRRQGLTIVICHFGNPWFEDVAELIYKHPNVYADISGLTAGGGAYSQRLEEGLARRLSEAVYFAGGAEKIFFGTDYPVMRVTDALKIVRLLEIDEADKRRILWGNAKRVFRL